MRFVMGVVRSVTTLVILSLAGTCLPTDQTQAEIVLGRIVSWGGQPKVPWPGEYGIPMLGAVL